MQPAKPVLIVDAAKNAGENEEMEKQNKTKQKPTGLTFSSGLSFALSGEVFLEFTSSHLILFDLLATQALDLLEKLGHFVGHGLPGFEGTCHDLYRNDKKKGQKEKKGQVFSGLALKRKETERL